MHRFFVPPDSIQNNQVVFPPDISHQICRVLRLHPGQRVIVLDGSGNEYEVEIVRLEPHAVQADIRLHHAPHPALSPSIHLFLSLTQRDKFEWMLQKCCEAGASSFTPFISSRSLVQDSAGAQSKLPRWQKILQEAAEQCGRRDLPIIHPVVRWSDALRSAQTSPLSILAWEQERSTNLREALASRPKQLSAFVGPEGGFSNEEVNEAQHYGARLITLGPRTLRMETAAVVMTALIMHELETS